MRKILLIVSLGAVLIVGQAGVAQAGPVDVDAVVTAEFLGGTRILTAASVTPLLTEPGTNTMTATVAAAVGEVAVEGSDWTVTAAMTTALTDLSDPLNFIDNSNLVIDGRTVTKVGLGTSKSTAGTNSGSLSGTVLLNDPSTETVGAAYSDSYVDDADLTLTVPSGTTLASYRGVMTITLIN